MYYRRYVYVIQHEMHVFSALASISLPGAGLSRVLGAGHTEGGRIHYGASLGPGRAPWRVLRQSSY